MVAYFVIFNWTLLWHTFPWWANSTFLDKYVPNGDQSITLILLLTLVGQGMHVRSIMIGQQYHELVGYLAFWRWRYVDSTTTGPLMAQTRDWGEGGGGLCDPTPTNGTSIGNRFWTTIELPRFYFYSKAFYYFPLTLPK